MQTFDLKKKNRPSDIECVSFLNSNLSFGVKDFTPASISDLYLWFPDFNLSLNGAPPNFIWLDEVSKLINITGSYGLGGIETINGLNCLRREDIDSLTPMNLINPFNVDELTFFGIIEKNNQDFVSFSWHVIRRNLNQDSFGFGANTASQNDNKYKISTNSVNRYSCGDSFNYPIIVNIPQIVFVRYRYFGLNSGFLELIAWNGTRYQDSKTINIPKGAWDGASYSVITGSIAGTGYNATAGEFGYYNRFLSDAEINLLGNYLSSKYNLAWVNI